MQVKGNVVQLVSIASGVYLGAPMVLLSIQLYQRGDTVRATVIGGAGVAVIFLPEYIRTQLPSLRSLLSTALATALPTRLTSSSTDTDTASSASTSNQPPNSDEPSTEK